MPRVKRFIPKPAVDLELGPISMVERFGEVLIVRSIITGEKLYIKKISDGTTVLPDNGLYEYGRALAQKLKLYYGGSETQAYGSGNDGERRRRHHARHPYQQVETNSDISMVLLAEPRPPPAPPTVPGIELTLPQCKIRRNYHCSHCPYYTQNPRHHLMHLRDIHGEKIQINECKECVYASRYFQKLVRHMKMVHGCNNFVGDPQRVSRRSKRDVFADITIDNTEQRPVLPEGGNVSTPLLSNSEQYQSKSVAPKPEQGKPQPADMMEHFSTAYNLLLRSRENALQALLSESLNMQDSFVAVGLQEVEASVDISTLPTSTAELFSQSSCNSFSEIAASTSKAAAASSAFDRASASAAETTLSPIIADRIPQRRILKCSVCGLLTVYRLQLSEHEAKDHSKVKFFHCEKCAYSTHVKSRFAKHRRYHEMPIKKCELCDFQTPYKWNLDRHMKNHGGVGTFKCTACNFSADLRQSLTVHEMNHHVPPVGQAKNKPRSRVVKRIELKLANQDC